MRAQTHLQVRSAESGTVGGSCVAVADGEWSREIMFTSKNKIKSIYRSKAVFQVISQLRRHEKGFCTDS